RAAIRNPTARIGITEKRHDADIDASSGNALGDLAAIGDAARKSGGIADLNAAGVRRDDAAVADADAGVRIPEDSDVADDNTQTHLGCDDLASVADAACESGGIKDFDATGVARDGAAVSDAADAAGIGKEANALNENSVLGPRRDLATVANAA